MTVEENNDIQYIMIPLQNSDLVQRVASRNNLPETEKFREIAKVIKEQNHNSVVLSFIHQPGSSPRCTMSGSSRTESRTANPGLARQLDEFRKMSDAHPKRALIIT